ncbi:hypothetical protein CEXT_497591, partial [Caerostris extrusa]
RSVIRFCHSICRADKRRQPAPGGERDFGHHLPAQVERCHLQVFGPGTLQPQGHQSPGDHRGSEAVREVLHPEPPQGPAQGHQEQAEDRLRRRESIQAQHKPGKGVRQLPAFQGFQYGETADSE